MGHSLQELIDMKPRRSETGSWTWLHLGSNSRSNWHGWQTRGQKDVQLCKLDEDWIGIKQRENWNKEDTYVQPQVGSLMMTEWWEKNKRELRSIGFDLLEIVEISSSTIHIVCEHTCGGAHVCIKDCLPCHKNVNSLIICKRITILFNLNDISYPIHS